MHRLLERQLRYLPPNSEARRHLEDFIDSINKAYEQFESDRALLENSLELTSQELLDKNRKLESQLQGIEKMSELFRLLFEKAPIGMAIATTENKLSIVNEAFCEITGFSETELILMRFDDLIHPKEQENFQEKARKLWEGKREHIHIELKCQGKDGLDFFVILHGFLLKSKRPKDYRIIYQMINITKRKEAEQLLLYQAQHDYLTGLYNRAYLMEALKQALQKKQENSDYHFAVLFFDLDRFKLINDSLGHYLGDDLLKEIAKRINRALSSSDIVARLGGDEFVVFLNDLKAPEEALGRAKEIQSIFSTPFSLKQQKLHINASLGIAIATENYADPEELLRDADRAMYYAKSKGKAQLAIYDEELHAKSINLLAIEHQLREVMEKDQLDVFFQPICRVKTNEIVGAEALLRFKCPFGIQDDCNIETIISVAEQSGLIHEIGRYVLEESCKFTHAMHQEGFEEFRISVNVSPIQLLNENFTEELNSFLKQYPLPKGSLVLELTEGVLMETGVSSIKNLKQIKALHVQLSIDDFGTGFSSLSYLQKFPIDFLKVDRSFVDGIPENEGNTAITASVITLGQILGLKVVAEGIETEKQLSFIRSFYCQFYQGYFMSPPLSQQDFRKLLKSKAKSSKISRTKRKT